MIIKVLAEITKRKMVRNAAMRSINVIACKKKQMGNHQIHNELDGVLEG